MQAQSRMKLWREGQVNSFLLCTVLAKQTRRLERLMPDRRIPELIMLALKNCADYELALDVDAGVPEVVREEAMQIGRLTRRPAPAVASRPGQWDGSQIAHAVSAGGGQGPTEGEPADEASLLGEGAIGARRSVGGRVDSPDFRRNLHSVQRKPFDESFQWRGPNSSPAASSDGRELMHASESASRKSQLRRGPCTVRSCFVRGARDPHSRE